MFEILEHTADIGIRAQAPTLPELHAEAALALTAVAVERDAIAPAHEYPLAASGDDPESLLVNWLSEVLFYLDARRILLCRYHLTVEPGARVFGIAYGEPRDDQRHRPRLVVKGVTWHQLLLEERNGLWQCEVFLDI